MVLKKGQVAGSVPPKPLPEPAQPVAPAIGNPPVPTANVAPAPSGNPRRSHDPSIPPIPENERTAPAPPQSFLPSHISVIGKMQKEMIKFSSIVSELLGQTGSLTKTLLFNNAPSSKQQQHSNLEQLVSGIAAIGKVQAGKVSNVVDGIWGNNTQIALKNISSLMSSLSKVGQALGLEIETGLSEKLSEFNDALKAFEEKANSQELSNRAAKITEDLDYFILSINNLFKELSAKYGDKLSGTGSIAVNLVQNKFNALDQKIQHSLGDQKVSLAIPKDLNNNETIKVYPTIDDLQSVDSFQKFLTANQVLVDGEEPTNPSAFQKLVHYLKTQAASGVSLLTSTPGY